MADTRQLVGLCLSLLISSLTISLVTGTGAASLGDIGGTVSQNIDFETDKHGWTNDILTVAVTGKSMRSTPLRVPVIIGFTCRPAET